MTHKYVNYDWFDTDTAYFYTRYVIVLGGATLSLWETLMSLTTNTPYNLLYSVPALIWLSWSLQRMNKELQTRKEPEVEEER